MKKLIVVLNMILMMSSCISATPVSSRKPQKVTVVTTSPIRGVSPKRSQVIVKKVVIGTRVRKLPARQVVIRFNSTPFIYAEGVFYRQVSLAEYEVVKPEIGMVVPQLPDYNVQQIHVKGETLFLFDDILYEQITTSQGIQYRVAGFVD